jgi:hypothetical protein
MVDKMPNKLADVLADGQPKGLSTKLANPPAPACPVRLPFSNKPRT